MVDGTAVDNAFTIQATAANVAQGIAVEDFDDIVRRHQRRVYRVLYLLLGNADAADTLTQECFLRAYRKRETFRGECRIDTWLVRIAVNLARDYRRSGRSSFWRKLVGLDDKPAEVAEKVSDPRGSPERVMLAQSQLEAVWNAARELPRQQRTIFLLRFGEDMTLNEISAVTGLKVGSVKAHLFRAIRGVRAAMKEQQWE
jgi:RNA polymerase sigma-70 factor (ECF subfamily)